VSRALARECSIKEQDKDYEKRRRFLINIERDINELLISGTFSGNVIIHNATTLDSRLINILSLALCERRERKADI
jgi:hypothetical protein